MPRKTKITCLASSFLSCLFLCLCWASISYAASYPRTVTKTETASSRTTQPAQAPLENQPRTFAEPQVMIEELHADLYSDNTVLLVRGKITNKTRRPVNGYLLVNILDKSDNVITAFEATINEGRKFDHGKAKNFEVQIDVSEIKDMANVAIEFVQP